jgi:hypothetical protein
LRTAEVIAQADSSFLGEGAVTAASILQMSFHLTAVHRTDTSSHGLWENVGSERRCDVRGDTGAGIQGLAGSPSPGAASRLCNFGRVSSPLWPCTPPHSAEPRAEDLVTPVSTSVSGL